MDILSRNHEPVLEVSMYVDISNCCVEKIRTVRFMHVLIEVHGVRVRISHVRNWIYHLILNTEIILMHDVIIDICFGSKC